MTGGWWVSPPYALMHLRVPGIMGCTFGTQALPGLPSSTSSCNSLLPVSPCLSLNDLWLSMASVCRPEREDLSLWCIPFPTPGENPTQHKARSVEAPAEDSSVSRGRCTGGAAQGALHRGCCTGGAAQGSRPASFLKG